MKDPGELRDAIRTLTKMVGRKTESAELIALVTLLDPSEYDDMSDKNNLLLANVCNTLECLVIDLRSKSEAISNAAAVYFGEDFTQELS